MTDHRALALAIRDHATAAERIEAGWVVYRLAAEALARGLDRDTDALVEALSLLEALSVLRGGPSLRPRTVVPGAAGLLVAHTALDAAVREALASDPGLAAEGEDARVRSEW